MAKPVGRNVTFYVNKEIAAILDKLEDGDRSSYISQAIKMADQHKRMIICLEYLQAQAREICLKYSDKTELEILQMPVNFDPDEWAKPKEDLADDKLISDEIRAEIEKILDARLGLKGEIKR